MREIIEDARSQDLERGINIAILNSRGMTWRALETGGQPERLLADKYQDYAQRVGTQWPRTQRMLHRIAENWDQLARQEDQLCSSPRRLLGIAARDNTPTRHPACWKEGEFSTHEFVHSTGKVGIPTSGVRLGGRAAPAG